MSTRQKFNISRRELCGCLGDAGAAAFVSGGSSLLGPCSIAAGAAKANSGEFKPIKLLNCDLNWSRKKEKVRRSRPSDWANIDAKEYFDWHIEMGNNAIYCQAYNEGGYAHYPSKLGPLGEGKSKYLLPKLFELSQKAKIPFWSYFTVSATGMEMDKKEYAEERIGFPHGRLEPNGPHTDTLCARIEELLKDYPVDWILFDMFSYGRCWHQNTAPLPVENPWARKGFKDLFGREMPEKASDITPEETLLYKREALARQFRRIRDSVKNTCPSTKIIFNAPYINANEPIWVNHPMVIESDGLFAESTNEAVVEWLLKIRKPHQRVMVTLVCNSVFGTGPKEWRKWYERGCDFFAYVWGDAPDWRPVSSYAEELKIVREAFHTMP